METLDVTGDVTLLEQPRGFELLDELASELGVGAAQEGNDISLEGKSGTHYSLTELLLAHIREMHRERSG